MSVQIALAAEVARLRAELAAWHHESARLDSGLSACKEDAEKWGNALNEAGRAFDEAYRAVLGEPTTARLFNNLKPILREAIMVYVRVAIDAARKGEE